MSITVLESNAATGTTPQKCLYKAQDIMLGTDPHSKAVTEKLSSELADTA